MDRRTFLGALGATGAGVSANPPISDLRSLLSSSAERLDKIGLQLYTLRKSMATSVEKTLYEVAQLGYKEVEFAGYFERPPRAIQQLLKRNGLSSPSAHVNLGTLTDGWFRTLDGAAEIGQKWLVVPSLPTASRDSLEAVQRTAETMNKAAEDAKPYKIRVAFHNHDIEFTDVGGRRILDVLLEETDPKLVDFELDLYWITKAGADPFDYFARFPKRFPLVHVKDSAGA
ncbi:MAG TPA: sugar phosphate isomerase/epimerase, partial [Gemmatimonadales bacterium]|nr:sugar phosphate isomerase/epimerase [Gemmatimonadales bacterium]